VVDLEATLDDLRAKVREVGEAMQREAVEVASAQVTRQTGAWLSCLNDYAARLLALDSVPTQTDRNEP
jgi:hypothetical protein